MPATGRSGTGHRLWPSNSGWAAAFASSAPSRAARSSSSSGPPTQRFLSSSWESFGLVVAEALAVGTPVISTAVGGVVEVLEEGRNGLLVPVGDHEALAAAIRRFFADAELQARLRAAAAPSVERLAPERIYARLERILEDAAKR